MKSRNNTINLPPYADIVYSDIYNNLNRSSKLDSDFSVKLRSFFQYDRLVKSVTRELLLNQTVLQMGLVFGYEIDAVAQKIGAYGQYDIIDVNPVQIARNQKKYGNMYPCLNLIQQDASTFNVNEQYDCVICFMLLQELPSQTKSKVINNALRAVKPGGRVIFVDYHNPVFWHPLRYWVRMYNRLYHPFAEKLWDKGIETYANNRTNFSWRKSTYFGGMYQRLIAVKKTDSLTDLDNSIMKQETTANF